MKKIFHIFLFIFAIFSLIFQNKIFQTQNAFATTHQKPMMCIVIDDYGSFDQSGVKILARCTEPLTCAIIPNVDNSIHNANTMSELGHEIILHMPMESHVNLPTNWYGPTYIKTTDSPETAKQKLAECLKQFPNVKGFNIHIGSGVSRNETLMTAIYEFAQENNLYFLDSRTIETSAVENACKKTNSVYLGRDVFLEADKNRSYQGVVNRLLECANIAKEKGYAIAIGHVGAEGGENTANAILHTLRIINEMGVEIVPLEKIHQHLK